MAIQDISHLIITILRLMSDKAILPKREQLQIRLKNQGIKLANLEDFLEVKK